MARYKTQLQLELNPRTKWLFGRVGGDLQAVTVKRFFPKAGAVVFTPESGHHIWVDMPASKDLYYTDQSEFIFPFKGELYKLVKRR